MPKGLSLLCSSGLGVPPLRGGRASSKSAFRQRALPSPHLPWFLALLLPFPPVLAQPRAWVCYCEGARGKVGAGCVPELARASGRRGGSARRARRGGAGLGIFVAPPGLPNPDWLPAPGAREGAACRAGRGAREARRSVGRRVEEERGEEGEGREKAPAWLPAKRPYLSGHSLSLPGGRLGATDPLPPGSSFRGAAEVAGQAGAPGAGCGRALLARPAPLPPSRFASAHAGLPMTGGRPANSVA